jgi:hypothetical protein
VGDEDPRMRFRVWVAARLVDEAWADASNPDAAEHVAAIRARHKAITELAQQRGRPWLCEIYDPERPEHGHTCASAPTRPGWSTPGAATPGFVLQRRSDERELRR